MSSLPAHPDADIESESRVWDGRFPLDVVRFRQHRFDGSWSGTRTWELWRRGRAAALLPYDPAQDAVVLIEQFRLPALAAGIAPVLVELPAGLCDGNETPEQTVRREAVEEMGIVPDRLIHIGDVLLSPGGSDEFCAVFAGRVSVPQPEGILGHAGMAAEHEDIRVRVWPAGRACAAALAGKFPNALTMIALLWLNARQESLRAEWME